MDAETNRSLTMTTKPATEIAAMTDADLRSYRVERIVAKWGEDERAEGERTVAKQTRGAMLRDCAMEAAEGSQDEKILMAACKKATSRSENAKLAHAARD
jgi:hypothetical protein